MIGIMREHVKERIAEYRKQFPDDTREDWVIGEAIGFMMQPKNYNRHLKTWIFRQVNEDQLSGGDVVVNRRNP